MLLNLGHNFCDALLFLENIVGELFGRKMLEVSCGVGVLAVEVAAVGEQFGGGNFPGAVVLFALVPPLEAAGEFLELDRLGLGVVLPAFGQRLLVVPDFFRRMRSGRRTAGSSGCSCTERRRRWAGGRWCGD